MSQYFVGYHRKQLQPEAHLDFKKAEQDRVSTRCQKVGSSHNKKQLTPNQLAWEENKKVLFSVKIQSEMTWFELCFGFEVTRVFLLLLFLLVMALKGSTNIINPVLKECTSVSLLSPRDWIKPSPTTFKLKPLKVMTNE